MMENSSKSNPSRKILILISVIAFVLAGWLAGHILRFSIPEFWRPTIEEITPQILNGFESEGIRREFVFSENLTLRVIPNEGALYLGQVLLNACAGNTYYTSLPAKCRSASGELVQVGEDASYIILMPAEK